MTGAVPRLEALDDREGGPPVPSPAIQTQERGQRQLSRKYIVLISIWVS